MKIFSKATSLKPFSFPEGFVLIIDTREQLPLFSNPVLKGLVMVRDTLQNGDYSIKGFENRIMVERKQVSDLISYVGRDHKQTRAKLDRCTGYDFRAIAIEAAEADLLSSQLYASVPPETIRQALASFEVRYNIHLYYSRDRKDIERWILDRFVKYFRQKREEK